MSPRVWATSGVLALSLAPSAVAQMDTAPPPGAATAAEADPDVVVDGAPAPSGIPPEARARIDTALAARDYARAEQALLAVLETQPESVEALRMLGGVFFLQGRARHAAGAYRRAQALAPLDERSRFTLVMAYVTLGRRDWARPELEALVAASPANPLYHYWLARLDYDAGQHDAAVQRLLKVVELDPGYVKAWDNLGLNYEALGRFDEAVRSYEEAIGLNRDSPTPSPWPALNLGLLLTKLDRLDEAETRFRESVAADPAFPQAHYQLGLLLDKTGRSEAAVPELEEAARLDESYAEPHFALARLYRRAGEEEKAREALERFQAIKKGQEEGAAGPE